MIGVQQQCSLGVDRCLRVRRKINVYVCAKLDLLAEHNLVVVVVVVRNTPHSGPIPLFPTPPGKRETGNVSATRAGQRKRGAAVRGVTPGAAPC